MKLKNRRRSIILFQHHATHFIVEQGQRGIFYLHPNSKGAEVLGEFWGKAIRRCLKN